MIHLKDPSRGFVVYNMSCQSDLLDTCCENMQYRNFKISVFHTAVEDPNISRKATSCASDVNHSMIINA
jgi:hypothetical protein